MHRLRQESRTAGVEGVELQIPSVHIVRPLMKHPVQGIDHPVESKGHIMVKKPVQLHVLDDVPLFREKFETELFSIVCGLRDTGEEKINIHFDSESPNADFIRETGRKMGFYAYNKILAINTRRFDKYRAGRKA